MEKKSYFSKKTQWKIIAFGMFLPLIMMIAVGMVLSPAQLFSDLKQMLSDGAIIPFIFIIPPLNAIPFIVLINLTNLSFNIFTEKGAAPSFPNRLGTILAWILALVFSVFVSLGVWIQTYNPNMPSSSTDAIAFSIGPIFTTIVLIPGGYGLGWVIGKLKR